MTTTYSAGEFYRRLTLLSVQDTERWGAVPAAVRQEIMDWHLEENIRHHDLVHKLELLRQDPDSVTIHNRDILLLEEALAIVDAAELHVVVTCDCRTLNMACDRPHAGTCIRLDERGEWTLAGGEGTVVSKERCREIVIQADRAGLLHTGQRAEVGRKATLNGNCCPCCSYPIRAGVMLNMAKKWPRSHYLAQVNWDRCTHCGDCVDRCPFDALERSTVPSTEGREAQVRVLYRMEQCWGCGLCATTCPEDAIVMAPLGEQLAV
jgi:ferredoxin